MNNEIALTPIAQISIKIMSAVLNIFMLPLSSLAFFFRGYFRAIEIFILNEKWWFNATPCVYVYVENASPLAKYSFFLWRLHVNQCREQNVINDKFVHWKIEADKCGSKSGEWFMFSCALGSLFFFSNVCFCSVALINVQLPWLKLPVPVAIDGNIWFLVCGGLLIYALRDTFYKIEKKKNTTFHRVFFFLLVCIFCNVFYISFGRMSTSGLVECDCTSVIDFIHLLLLIFWYLLDVDVPATAI